MSFEIFELLVAIGFLLFAIVIFGLLKEIERQKKKISLLIDISEKRQELISTMGRNIELLTKYAHTHVLDDDSSEQITIN